MPGTPIQHGPAALLVTQQASLPVDGGYHKAAEAGDDVLPPEIQFRHLQPIMPDQPFDRRRMHVCMKANCSSAAGVRRLQRLPQSSGPGGRGLAPDRDRA